MLKILPLAKVRFASHALLLLEAAWHRSEKTPRAHLSPRAIPLKHSKSTQNQDISNKTYYTYCNLYRGKLEKSRIVEILKVRFSLFYFSFRARLVTSTPLAKPKPEDFCGTPCHCGHCDFQDEMCEVSRITGLPLNKSCVSKFQIAYARVFLPSFWDVWDLIQGTNVQRPTKGSLNLFALLNARIVSYTCRAQTHKPHTFWSLLCMLSATTSWYNKRSVISHFLFTTLCWFSSCSCVATCANEMWVLFICKSVCSGCTFPKQVVRRIILDSCVKGVIFNIRKWQG